MCSRIVEAAVDALALDRVARMTAGNEIVRIYLAFPCARQHEIDGHDEGVFEAGVAIEPAVPAAVAVAFQDL